MVQLSLDKRSYTVKELSKDSKTYKNLQAAFAGESQAAIKYGFFAKQAKKDGYEQICGFFNETSDNEKAHAKIWYKYLNGGSVADTKTNLGLAAEGENYEWTDMYNNFAAEAREEGYDEIAAKFDMVGSIEKEHEARYLRLRENIEHDVVFKNEDMTVWKCRECGNIYVGKEAPEICPVCSHPRAYFEIRAENY